MVSREPAPRTPLVSVGGRAGAAAEPGPVDTGTLLAVAPDGVFVVDVDGHVLYLNPAAEEMVGHPARWCRGRHVAEFVHPDDLMLVVSSLGAVQDKPSGTPIEVRLAGPGGGWRWLEIIGRDCRDVPGVGGIVCTARDLTQRRMWEVAGSDVARFQQIVHHAAAIVLSLDVDGAVTSVNGAFTRILGHDPSVVVGSRLAGFAAPGSERHVDKAVARAGAGRPVSVEVPMRQAGGGRAVPVRLELVNLLDDPVIEGLVVTGQDVSELHDARRRLEHLATHDPLTGLPNRSVLDERLRHLVGRGRPLALLYVDLDRFKAVNDTRGHDAGDEVLRCVAQRLVEGVDDGDLVARVGGDEFVVVALGVSDRETAVALADRLRGLVSAPYRLRAGSAHIGASVGAIVSGPASTAAELMAEADRAMYAVKTRTAT